MVHFPAENRLILAGRQEEFAAVIGKPHARQEQLPG